MLNGMLQLMVDESARQTLLSLVPWDMDNTLQPGQVAHHVTLAFKPDDDEADRLRKQFAAGDATFHAKDVRWSDHICAVFGTVKVDGVELPEERHVTLAGTVSPVKSNDLKAGLTGVESEPVTGKCGMKFTEVSF